MHNAIIDISFSDTQTSTSDLGSASILTYVGIGDEITFQDDRLIGATIFLLFRDGLQYREITGTPDPNAKEFDLDEDTGDILFAAAPMPPLQPGEIVTIFYAFGDQSIVLTEPVTLAEAKAWLKVEVDDDDDLINDLIPAARAICEEFVGQSLVQRTITAVLRNDLGNIRLPYGPVGSVASLKDSDDTDITITDTTFIGIHFLRLNYTNGIGGTFGGDPRRNGDLLLNEQGNNLFTLVYSAGYASCPPRFKTAIKHQIIWMYQHRGEEEMISQLSPMAKAILNQSRAIV